MEKIEDYSSLYRLQDSVLSIVFDCDNSFYLTGGTALHRFYYNLRYSDDLDFFTQADPLFGENIREIVERLESEGFSVRRTVQAKDFHRIIVHDKLQVDFINDRVFREGKSRIVDGFRIDNIRNILTNKINAVVDRDEEKDVFDLCAICMNEQFDWSEMTAVADKKSPFNSVFFAERLLQFPLQWLDNIKSVKDFTITEDMLKTISDDVLNGRGNSLKRLDPGS